jgi:hypothetical protein
LVNFTPWPLYPREITPIGVKREAEQAVELVWSFGKQTKLLHLPGFELQFFQPVA